MFPTSNSSRYKFPLIIRSDFEYLRRTLSNGMKRSTTLRVSSGCEWRTFPQHRSPLRAAFAQRTTWSFQRKLPLISSRAPWKRNRMKRSLALRFYFVWSMSNSYKFIHDYFSVYKLFGLEWDKMITANMYTINWMLLKRRWIKRTRLGRSWTVWVPFWKRKSLIKTPLIVFVPALIY